MSSTQIDLGPKSKTQQDDRKGVSPDILAMIARNDRYIAAGSGLHLRPLCFNIMFGQPCVYDAAACPNHTYDY